MSDFTPLMPGIKGGCRTVVGDGVKSHDVTFTARATGCC